MSTTPTDVSPIEKAQDAYQQLVNAAQHLNVASDQLAVIVEDWEAALRKLNLGISAWIRITSDDSPHPFYDVHELGYDKIGQKWCVALRRVWGREDDEQAENSEEWVFNEAPRWLRIIAIDRMPDLLAALMDKTQKTSESIVKVVARAKCVSSAIRQLADQKSKKSK